MQHDEIDELILAARAAHGDAGALREALHQYGSELLGFIQDRLSNPADAEDVFADFAENLWTSFARFRGECSMRTWCYVIARRAIARQRRGQKARKDRHASSEPAFASEIAAEVRSRTAPFMRTEVKNEARRLRESMADDDQQLLLLRLERNLSFRDIALILSDDDALGQDELVREAARLRKRFQIAKDRLSELLINAGLVQSD
jgi:RNA polymerase sigma-70 factor (ECF subfamily)